MEQDIGYLKGKLEGLEKKVADHIIWEEEYHDKFDQKLSKIDDALHEHLTFYRFAKAIVYTIVFLAAFKFGDIHALWQHKP